MVKEKKMYICQVCGYSSFKWQGRCPQCGEWDSFLLKDIGNEKKDMEVCAEVKKYSDIEIEEENRIKSGIDELDRVLGGGIVKGSVVLLGGHPGAGKSTLLLQMAFLISNFKKVLYVSGEESLSQIKMRGKRLGINSKNLFLSSTTSFEKLINSLKEIMPDILIVDSIQTINSSNFTSTAGTVVQINYCTKKLVEFSKTNLCSTFIVGHITKGGFIAGPKILEHLVDVVLYFEGEKVGYFNSTRILRAVKNRFGPINEVGIFEMKEKGLISVEDPSRIFVSQFKGTAPGVSYFCTVEGVRPIVVEIQSLVSLNSFSNARRMSTTYDRNRISLLLAMLERTTGLNLIPADVYLNVAGGIQLNETGADLSVVAAIISSFKRKTLPEKSVFMGEISLSGGIKVIPLLKERIIEAKRLGFEKFFIPEIPFELPDIEFVKIGNISELLDFI